jgi:hypothetical protein
LFEKEKKKENFGLILMWEKSASEGQNPLKPA